MLAGIQWAHALLVNVWKKMTVNVWKLRLLIALPLCEIFHTLAGPGSMNSTANVLIFHTLAGPESMLEEYTSGRANTW